MPIETGVAPQMERTLVKSLWRRESAEQTYRWSAGSMAFLALGTLLGTGATQSTPAHAETRFTPSATLSERYDSNVWYSPKDTIPPGNQQWDFVTSLGAQAQVENKSRLGDSMINAGVNASAFAYNHNLAFVSTNIAAASDLSDWAKELLPGLKFNVNDAFLYTPETPAFLSGGNLATSSDIFSRGLQAVRADTYSNIFRAHAEYNLARPLDIRADYAFSIFRLGQLVFNPTGTDFTAMFFNSTVHTASGGPVYRLEGGDTLYFKYQYMTASSVPASGEGNSIAFSGQTFTPEYVTHYFRGWTLTMNAGVTLVEQAGNRAFFSGKFGVGTDLLDRALRVQAAVSRQVAPAFFGTGGALISNVAQLYVTRKFTKTLALTVSGNFAYNESAPVASFTFESITGLAALEYKITRTYKVSLSQEYNRITYTGTPTFDRYATMLILGAEWK